VSVIIPNAVVSPLDHGRMSLMIPTFYQGKVGEVVERCLKKHNGFCKLTIDVPFKPRSTGYKSANHHLRGHEQQIAMAVPCTLSEVHETIKEELADWPERVINGPRGTKFIKASEADISSAVCAAAIELCHVWAAHLGITLIEEATK
jgi:hypothetical protein